MQLRPANTLIEKDWPALSKRLSRPDLHNYFYIELKYINERTVIYMPIKKLNTT